MMKSKILLVVSYIAVGLFLLSGCMKNEETEGTKKIRDAYAAKIDAQTKKELAEAAYQQARADHELAQAAVNNASAEWQRLQTTIANSKSEADIKAAKAKFEADYQLQMAQAKESEARLERAKQDLAQAINLYALLGEDQLKWQAYDQLYKKLFIGVTDDNGDFTKSLYGQKTDAFTGLQTAQEAYLKFVTADKEEIGELKKFMADEAEKTLQYHKELLTTYETYIGATSQSLEAKKDGIASEVAKAKRDANKAKQDVADSEAKVNDEKLARNKLYEQLGDASKAYYPVSSASGYPAEVISDVYKYPEYITSDPTIAVNEDLAAVNYDWKAEAYDKTTKGLKGVVDFLNARIDFLDKATGTDLVALANGWTTNKFNPGTRVQVSELDNIIVTLVSVPWIDQKVKDDEKSKKGLENKRDTELTPNKTAAVTNFKNGYDALKGSTTALAATSAETAYVNYSKTTGAVPINDVNKKIRDERVWDFLNNNAGSTVLKTNADTVAVIDLFADFLYQHYKFDGFHGGVEIAVYNTATPPAPIGTKKCVEVADFRTYLRRSDRHFISSRSNLLPLIRSTFGGLSSLISEDFLIGLSNFQVVEAAVNGTYRFTDIGDVPIYPNGFQNGVLYSPSGSISILEYPSGSNTFYSLPYTSADYKASTFGKFITLAYSVYGVNTINNLSQINLLGDYANAAGVEELDYPVTNPNAINANPWLKYFAGYHGSLHQELKQAERIFDNDTKDIKLLDEEIKALGELKTVCNNAIAALRIELAKYDTEYKKLLSDIATSDAEVSKLDKDVVAVKLEYNILVKKLNELEATLNKLNETVGNTGTSDVDIVKAEYNRIVGLIGVGLVDGASDNKLLAKWQQALIDLELVDNAAYKAAQLSVLQNDIDWHKGELDRINALILSVEKQINVLYPIDTNTDTD